MKKIISFIIGLMTVAACSEEDNFVPGPLATNTKGSAWFVGDYKTSYYYYERPEEEDSIYIYVQRADTVGDLDLPIVSQGDPEVVIPSSVHFADGDSMTYLAIASPELRLSVPAAFSLQIPAEYADPYAEKDGITNLTSSILWSSWTPVADTVLMISSYGLFPRQGGMLENFLGDNVFRITNFLGSGNPLIFSLSNKVNTDDLTRNSGSITPLENAYYGNSYSDKIWDWSNDGEWAPFTPAGGSFEISYVEFGWGHYYYPSTPYDNFDFSVTEADTIKLKNGSDTIKYVYDKNYYSKSLQMVYLYGTDSRNSAWDYIYFMVCYRKDEK